MEKNYLCWDLLPTCNKIVFITVDPLLSLPGELINLFSTHLRGGLNRDGGLILEGGLINLAKTVGISSP